MKLTSSLENHKASVETYKKKISQMEGTCMYIVVNLLLLLVTS